MNTGSALARFTITLSQAVTEPVQVDWFTSDGTAKAGVDYAANKGTVTFSPGQTSKTVDILVYGRAVGSEDRSFFVEMLPPTNAILGASIGECIITVDTSGSTPVTAIIVPTGPKGEKGDPGEDGVSPNPAEIAVEVAPLIDVGATTLTSEGTESKGKPDETTVKKVARRVAYAAPAKIATAVLADGENSIPASALTGDSIDFSMPGFVPLVLRAGVMSEPQWDIIGNNLLIVAQAGDVLYAVEYALTSTTRSTADLYEPLKYRKLRSFEKGVYRQLQNKDDVVLLEADGKFYQWNGAYPKTVNAGTTPVGDSNWVAVDSLTLRDNLASGATSMGDSLIAVMQPLAGAIKRTVHDKFADTYSVKDFGAIGNWNATDQTGADDTAAVNLALATMTAPFRKAGRVRLYFPAGHYKITSVALPTALEYGLDIVGDGMFSSYIWADQGNTDAAIVGNIELVQFSDIALMGTKGISTAAADWKDVFYLGKRPNGAPDIDVRYSRVYFGYAKDHIKAYGRGVVIDNTCIGVFCNYAVNIVCDPSIIFPAGNPDTNSYRTGMRNYDVSPQRTDVVSRLVRVTGTAACKDYINGITMSNIQMLSADRMIEFDDATITGLQIAGVSTLNSFSSAPVSGKRLINSLVDMTTAKQYDRDVAMSKFTSGIVTLTGPCSGLKVRGSYFGLVHHAVQVGGVSAGVDIDIQTPNLATDGQPFIAMRGANAIGLRERLVISGAAPTGTVDFFDSAVQTDQKIQCEAIGANVARGKIKYTPLFQVGGVNKTTGFAIGEFFQQRGYTEVDLSLSYVKPGSPTTSQVSITLPTSPAADFPSQTTAFAGMVIIKSCSLKTALRAEISMPTGVVVFYKADGTALTETDLPATLVMNLKVVYPSY